jgi:hypothetical protein
MKHHVFDLFRYLLADCCFILRIGSVMFVPQSCTNPGRDSRIDVNMQMTVEMSVPVNTVTRAPVVSEQELSGIYQPTYLVHMGKPASFGLGALGPYVLPQSLS